jgi:hypothetical protein
MLRTLSRSTWRRLFVASIISLGALTACGTARVITRNQVGGVIELQGDRGKAMEQANQEMGAHCGPGNFTITQEGEEAIGTDTFTREDEASDTKTSKSGRRSSTDTTATQTQSTRTATAWRVHYACGVGQAMGPGGPPPPPPPPGDPGAPPPPPSAPGDPPR